jgi:xanthine dehydrogenase accessory factor
MLIYPDGSISGTVGGGAVEKVVIEQAAQVLKSGAPKVCHYDLEKDLQMKCGGKMMVFIEPIGTLQQLFIFGAGHIGTALARLGEMLGFGVTIIDNRPEFANADRFPATMKVVAAEYDQALRELEFNEDVYNVIVTHRHAHDQEILEFCVDVPFRYLGMIGSAAKVKGAFKRLAEKGISKEVIDRIHSPIGINIGGHTPAEIAVSIAAEFVKVKNEPLKLSS